MTYEQKHSDGSVVQVSDAKDDPAAAACIEEILAVCERRGFALMHQDGQGAFELWTGAPAFETKEWLRDASLMIEIKPADESRPSSMFRQSCGVFGCSRSEARQGLCEEHLEKAAP